MTGYHAWSRAREVVGLYGDPHTTWKIALELGLAEALDRRQANQRLEELFARWPHLGLVPTVQVVPDEDWVQERQRVAASPNRADGLLVGVLSSASGHKVLAVAHHGLIDGLGLVALAGAVIGRPVVSHAQGIGDLSSPDTFLRSGLRRLGEALFRPPPRFAPHRPVAPTGGESLRTRTIERADAGSAELCSSLVKVFAAWVGSEDSSRESGLPVVALGASRRQAGVHVPDRQTAFLRLRLDPTWSATRVREALREAAPEPDFPETTARGLGPLVTGLLRNRLGATAQVSNLGVLEAEGLTYAAMFPAVNGPRAVAVGMASAGTTTSVTVRTRLGEFSAADTDDLLQRIVHELSATGGLRQSPRRAPQ